MRRSHSPTPLFPCLYSDTLVDRKFYSYLQRSYARGSLRLISEVEKFQLHTIALSLFALSLSYRWHTNGIAGAPHEKGLTTYAFRQLFFSQPIPENLSILEDVSAHNFS